MNQGLQHPASDEIRLFEGRGPQFTASWYSFKRHASNTDYCLDLPPNETYPDDLIWARAALWSVRDGGSKENHFSTIQADKEAFLTKLKLFRVRFLFSKADLTEYARGTYGEHSVGVRLTPTLRKLHLKACAILLLDFPKLEMGYSERYAELLYGVNDSGAILATRGFRPSTLWAVAIGPVGASAFRDHFSRLWSEAVTARERVCDFLDFTADYECG